MMTFKQRAPKQPSRSAQALAELDSMKDLDLLPHFSPYLSLFSFSLFLLSLHMNLINSSSIFTQIYHQIHLVLIIIIALGLVFSLGALSLSPLLVRKNEGRRRTTTFLTFHHLPPLSKVIFELNPRYYIID